MLSIYRKIIYCFSVTLIGLLLLFLTNVYFPYRPSKDEAIREVLALDQAKWVLNAKTYSSANTHIVFATSGVPQSQLVIATHDNLENQAVINRCISANYVTRHWLSGSRIYSGPSMCQPTSTDTEISDIVITEHQEQGTYILMGMSLNKYIAYIQARWTDGSIETIPIRNDSFVFFRANLDSSVAWVMGLDDEKQAIPETKVLNESNTVTLFEYERFRQVSLHNGIVIMGAYLSKSLTPKQCLQVTYLTTENAELYLTNEEAFTGQGICISTDSDDKLPAVTTFIDNNTVVGGLALDDAIVQVQIDWTDGFQQIVPVINGFYFVERPGTSVSAFTLNGLTSESNTILP